MFLKPAGYLLILVGSCFGQSPPIKGLVLGEKLDAFLSNQAGAQTFIDMCRSIAADHSLAGKWHVDAKRCASLLVAVDAGGEFKTGIGKVFDDSFSELGDSAVFYKGVLVSLTVTIGRERSTAPELADWSKFPPLVDYDDVLHDMIAKMGCEPTQTSVIEMQNRFGAVTPHRMATWSLEKVYATQLEVNGSTDRPLTTISVMTREEHERQLKAQDNRPNSLN